MYLAVFVLKIWRNYIWIEIKLIVYKFWKMFLLSISPLCRYKAILLQHLHPFIDGKAPPAAGECDAAVVPAAYVGGLPGPPEGLVQ